MVHDKTNRVEHPLPQADTLVTPCSSRLHYYPLICRLATNLFRWWNFAVGLKATGLETAATPEAQPMPLLLFDVTNNCTLKSVKVYTNTAGTRRFELRDAPTLFLVMPM